MDHRIAFALRRYASETKQGEKVVKRDWLKLNHRERGKMRKALVGRGPTRAQWKKAVGKLVVE